MASGDEFEASRKRRIAENAARLAQLELHGAAAAAGRAHKQRRKAARSELLGSAAPPRKQTSRAAAVRTKAKLQQQAAGSDSDDEIRNSSGTEGSQPAPRSSKRGAAADEEYDLLADANDTDDGSTSVEASDSGEEGSYDRYPPSKRRSRAKGAGQGVTSAATAAGTGVFAGESPRAEEPLGITDDGAALQAAIALSMQDVVAPPAQQQQQQVPSAVGRKPAAEAKRKQLRAGDAKSPAKEPAKEAAGGRQKKGGCQAKRQKAAEAPPSEEDILAVFEMFNCEQMSAIIASDIGKVALDTLGTDLTDAELSNMMTRAREISGLQQPRLDLEAFQQLVRHYCG